MANSTTMDTNILIGQRAGYHQQTENQTGRKVQGTKTEDVMENLWHDHGKTAGIILYVHTLILQRWMPAPPVDQLYLEFVYSG